MFRAKKIPDDYHTLDRAGQITLIRLCTGDNRLNSHMHREINLVPSDNITHTAKMSSIPTSQTTDMVRRNIIIQEAVWEERRTREIVGFIQQAG